MAGSSLHTRFPGTGRGTSRYRSTMCGCTTGSRMEVERDDGLRSSCHASLASQKSKVTSPCVWCGVRAGSPAWPAHIVHTWCACERTHTICASPPYRHDQHEKAACARATHAPCVRVTAACRLDGPRWHPRGWAWPGEPRYWMSVEAGGPHSTLHYTLDDSP